MSTLKFYDMIPKLKIVVDRSYNLQDLPKMTCSEDAFKSFWMNWDLDTIGHCESSYLLLLNQGNKMIGMIRLSLGGISSTVMDTRVIFQYALLHNATNIIIAHNHPSGNLTPSNADIQITEKIAKAGKLLSIQLLDHIVLAPDERYSSFADEGLL